MQNDAAVNYTVSELQRLIPNSIIVDYGTLGFYLTIPRASDSAIFVGHGTKEGIQSYLGLVTWNKFATLLKRVHARVYVASCYSDELSSFGLRGFFFNGLVDVDEAAYLVAATIMSLHGLTDRANDLLSELVGIMVGKIIFPWKYRLWLLAWDPGDPGGGNQGAHYVRGIWWVYWGEWQNIYNPVEYTHPNTYPWVDPDHYYDVGVDEEWGIKGDNFYAYHIPKSKLDSMQEGIAIALKFLIAGILLFFGLSGIAAVIAGIAGGIITGWAESRFFDIVRDESGGGWEYIKDLTVNWCGIYWWSFDWKLGAYGWWHFYYYFAYSIQGQGLIYYPLWYGGQDLGLGGI